MTLPDPDLGLEIDPAAVSALADRIAAGELQLVDCRETDEFAINRLPHARLVPLSNFVEAAAPVLAAAIPAIVYCHHGMRSLRAAHWLRAHGIDAWSMTGGIHRWSCEIDPDVPVY